MADIRRFYWRLAMVAGGGIILALVIFGGVVPLVEYLGAPAYLDVMVEGATVEIDGAEYRNAVYEMEPGRHTAKVSAGGSGETVELELDLARAETLGLYMRWSDESGWRYYTAEELKHQQAISEVLPVHLSICGEVATRMSCDAITVTYERAAGCGGEECVVIRGRGAELSDAVLTEVREKLNEAGYDLSDYRYIYMLDTNL